MRIIFFQNCISPHQLPYIKQCALNTSYFQEVYLLTPRIDYEYRMKMGWNSHTLLEGSNIKFILKPSNKQIELLLKENSNTVCLFSGIRGDKDIFQWFKLSLKYNVKRCIITEPPFIYNKPLWMHYLRFFLQDYKYIKYINGIFAIGELAVNYYKSISRKWKIFPFQYVTDSYNRTITTNLSGKFKLLFVGSLSRRKNVQVAIRALIGLRDIEFSIIGSGKEEQSLKQMANKHNLPVNFQGMKPNNKIHTIMENYDALILPSLYDGWGAVVNEAMTLGLFVIVSENCGAKMLIKDNKQGSVFKNNNADSLHIILDKCIKQKNIIRSELQNRLLLNQTIQAPVVANYFTKCLTSL